MQQLPQKSISKLNSDLIITSIWDILREALENSIDASADNIQIYLFNSGIDGLIVLDNGKGITPDGLAKVGPQGVTSKIDYQIVQGSNSRADIQLKFQESLGFRVSLTRARAFSESLKTPIWSELFRSRARMESRWSNCGISVSNPSRANSPAP